MKLLPGNNCNTRKFQINVTPGKNTYDVSFDIFVKPEPVILIDCLITGCRKNVKLEIL